MDREYQAGAGEWNLRKDERATLDESAQETEKQQKSQTASGSSKWKRFRKNHAMGLAAGALAVVMIAGTLQIPGFWGDCIYCGRTGCEFWNFWLAEWGMELPLTEEQQEFLSMNYEAFAMEHEAYYAENQGGSQQGSSGDQSGSQGPQTPPPPTTTDHRLANGLLDITDRLGPYGEVSTRGNGGRIVIRYQSLSTFETNFMDYLGNVIKSLRSDPKGSPNESGSLVLYEGDKLSEEYILYDADGKQVADFTDEFASMNVSDSGSYYTWGGSSEDSRLTYYKADGTVLYDSGLFDSEYMASTSVSIFRDGTAYFALRLPEDTEDQLYRLTEDGTLTAMGDFPYDWRGMPRDGYLVLSESQQYQYFLYDLGSGAMTGTLVQVPALLSYDEFGSCPRPEEDALETVSSGDLQSYESGTETYYHYRTFGVFEAANERKVLFDWRDIQDGILTKAIACYDEILFGDDEYLAVNYHGQWSYIDWTGAVVSPEVYDRAAAFGDDGYAIVLKQNQAQVIDRNFNVVHTIPDAQIVSVQEYGEVFLLEDVDGRYYLYRYEETN